ncbi:transmembrane protein, putative (macronuclear) [Tetrahymena thermophila SB210]|uniref:Transmembrane protein, putative n=1 Tax=Tetrahymena thermophila (strain SB210) TaxID=312017 RepID=Q22D79_TETTS|nr:transmembrane protein, putative [Tetrahymena thermophila SB210]EAR83246.2 transmembrane protein, putative [Tetrahymena thermophila SB210]|eukprot:XP_001030909.2 transmembrane protein, putative [Tetrahymena thermophila SB210]
MDILLIMELVYNFHLIAQELYIGSSTIQCNNSIKYIYSNGNFYKCDINCQDCRLNSDQDGVSCYICNEKYFFDSTKQLCIIPIQNCQVFQGSLVNSAMFYTCQQCYKGYIQDSTNSNCISCQSLLQNQQCIECNYVQQQIQCSRCQSGYYLNTEFQCVKCSLNCVECNFGTIYFQDIFTQKRSSQTREYCTRCQQYHGFNIDGISCVYCGQNNEICYYQAYSSIIPSNYAVYTVSPFFRVLTQAQIKSYKVSFQLITQYPCPNKCIVTTDSTYCIDDPLQQLNQCILCTSVYQSLNSTESFGYCSKCNSSFQMTTEDSVYKSKCVLKNCNDQCSECINDLQSGNQICQQCQPTGNADLQNINDLTQLQNILSTINQKIDRPLILVKEQFLRNANYCVPCKIGCSSCFVSDKINGYFTNPGLDQQIQNYPMYQIIKKFPMIFNGIPVDFTQSSQQYLNRVHLCSQCESGFMLNSKNQCVLQADQSSFNTYQITLSVYIYQNNGLLSDQLNQALSQLESEFGLYSFNTLDVNQVNIIIQFDEATYMVNENIFVKFHLIRNYLEILNRYIYLNITFQGMKTDFQNTTIIINSYISIFNFHTVTFVDLRIQIAQDKQIFFGDLDSYYQVYFERVSFFQDVSQEYFGFLALMSNIQNFTMDSCSFQGLYLKNDQFIQFIDYQMFDSNFEKQNKDFTIYLNQLNFIQTSFQKCFISTEYIGQNYLDFQLSSSNIDFYADFSNTNSSVSNNCFIRINSVYHPRDLVYADRVIKILNNTITGAFQNYGGAIFDIQTFDLVIMDQNTILKIEVQQILSAVILFSFYQGIISNTVVGSILANGSDFTLFDLTGPLIQYDLQYCVHISVNITNFKNIDPIETNTPLFKLDSISNNNYKFIYMSQISLQNIFNSVTPIININGVYKLVINQLYWQSNKTNFNCLVQATSLKIKLRELYIYTFNQQRSAFYLFSYYLSVKNIVLSQDITQVFQYINHMVDNIYFENYYDEQILSIYNVTNCYTNNECYTDVDICKQNLSSKSLIYLQNYTTEQNFTRNNILYDGEIFLIGQNYYPIKIKDIYIKKTRFLSPFIFISNFQSQVQKILIEDIYIEESTLDVNAFYKSLMTNSLFLSVNSNSSYVIVNNFTLNNVFQAYNHSSLDQQMIQISSSQTSLIQVQSTLLYSKQINYQMNISKYVQQSTLDSLVLFGRYVDFIGFQVYVKDSYFENIQSQSGGIVRFSPSSIIGNNLIQFQNITANNVSVLTVGGVLQVYTAYLGQDVKVFIFDCNFQMIQANYSGGLAYIENLGKSINMNISKTTLDTISAYQTSILELHNQAQHKLNLQDVLITERFQDTASQYYNYNKNSLFQINNANVIFYNTTILQNKGAIILIQSTSSRLRISNSLITQNEVYMQILDMQNGILELDSTIISFNILLYSIIQAIPNDQRFKDILINCKSPINCSYCNLVILLDSKINSNYIVGCSDSYMNFERSITLIKRCQIYNNTVEGYQSDIEEQSISIVKFSQKQNSNYSFNLILHSDIELNILTNITNGVVQVSSAGLLVYNTTFQSNNAGSGGGIYFGYQTSQDSTQSTKRSLEQTQINFEDEYQNRFLQGDQTVNIIDYDSYYLGQVLNYVEFDQRDLNYYKSIQLLDPSPLEVIGQSTINNQYLEIFSHQNTTEVLIIDKSIFSNNYAASTGGAINFVSCQEIQKCKFVLYDSNFTNNAARINSPAVNSLNHIPTLRNNFASLNHINNDLKEDYNVASFNIAPNHIKVNFNGTKDIYSLRIASGETQESGLVVELYSILNEQIVYTSIDTLPSCQLYFGDTKMVADYNVTSNNLVFNPFQLTYQPGKKKQLTISCSSVKVPYIDGNGVVINQNYMTYEKVLEVEFKNCSQGDIYLFDKQICSQCNKGSYTFDIPEKAICQVCPMGAYCAGGNKIQLQKSYWNDKKNSPSIVIQCSQNLDNCIGEVDSNGNTLPVNPFTPCQLGHIGALCEQCDIRATKTDKKYFQNGNYECGDCDSPQIIYIKISFVLLGCFIFAIITVYAIVSEVKNKILKSAFKIMGILLLGTNSQYFQVSSSLFKIFINYAQINFIIYTLKLNNPGYVTEVIQSIISPFKFLETGFDCALSYAFSLDIIYVKAYGYCLLPLFYYAIIIFLLCIIEIIHKKLIKAYYFYISGFFVTLFTIPSVVQYLVLVLSCRQIGAQKYITADVSLLCYTSQHVEYIKKLLIPSIVVYVFVVPLAMVTFLYFNKHKLQNNIFELKFGFLYREYKAIVFYWEIIRLVIKVIIYSVISIWDENVQAKALFSILMLIIYQHALNKTQPFKNDRLNFLEGISTSFNIFSIFIALFCKIADSIFFTYFGFSLVIGLNIIFLTYLGVDFYKIYKNGFNQFGQLIKKCFKKSLNMPQIQKEEKVEKKLSQSQLVAIQKWFYLKTFVLVYIQLKKIRIPVQIYSEEVFFIYNKIKKIIPLMTIEQIQKEMACQINENMKQNGYCVLKIESNSSCFINKLIEQNAKNLINFSLSDHLCNLKNFYDLQNAHGDRQAIFEGNTVIGKEITLNEENQQVRFRMSDKKAKTLSNMQNVDFNLLIQQDIKNENNCDYYIKQQKYSKQRSLLHSVSVDQKLEETYKQRRLYESSTHSKNSQEKFLSNQGEFEKINSLEEDYEQENDQKLVELAQIDINFASNQNKIAQSQQKTHSDTTPQSNQSNNIQSSNIENNKSSIYSNSNFRVLTSPLYNSGHSLTDKFKNHKTDPSNQTRRQTCDNKCIKMQKGDTPVNEENLEEVINFNSDDDYDDL